MEDYQRINKLEVSALCQVSARTLFNHISGQPCAMLAGLPLPVTRGRGSRLKWIKQDILDWLKSQRTFDFNKTEVAAGEPEQRKVGRPPNLPRSLGLAEGGAS